jgi:outer membrane protein assembly factor BamB
MRKEGITQSINQQIAMEKAQRAYEWPQWRGPNRNGSVQSAQTLARSWPDGGPQKLWASSDLPGGGPGSPVIANGCVYVYLHQNREEKDTVVCLDEKTGAKRWQRDFPVAQVEGDTAAGTPCISEKLCLVQGDRCCYSLDAATGALLWKTGPDARNDISSSLSVAAGN